MIITSQRVNNHQKEVKGYMKNQSATTSAIPTTGYIRRYRLAEMLGISLSTLDRKVRNGTLPKPTKLGEKITAFDAVEINQWLAERRHSA
jgi:predicted DNA-binding transcriptional regulator AlpA